MKKFMRKYIIIICLLIFICSLFIQNNKLMHKNYDNKSKEVYELKNNIIFLLENNSLSKEIENFIKRKIHVGLNNISPEIKSKEIRDEWNNYVSSIENINYKVISKDKSENFSHKYLNDVISISPIYNKDSINEDVSLKEFLQDIKNLKE